MGFARYALYYLPPTEAGWTQAATAWLGWDIHSGAPVAQPEPDGLPRPLSEITEAPRKYGLHATIRPPFALADGQTQDDLEEACATLCNGLEPVSVPGLQITRLGRFLALCPAEQPQELTSLAANAVEALNRFRSEMSDAELARRRGRGLSAEREANLTRWGYPHVMKAFRFHITLTGRLDKSDLSATEAVLQHALGPLPDALSIRELTLVGEDAQGCFHTLRSFPLGRATV